MNIDKFHEAIDFALKTLGKEEFSLKEAQYDAVKSVAVDQSDALVLLPTGYGKSLIYQTLPFIFDHLESTSSSLVIVVSPLNSLMQDQVEKLRAKINVSVLKVDNCKSVDPRCKIVFAHPEVFVSSSFRSSPLLKRKVKAIVVDEAHLVVEWKSFRPAYANVSMLSSYFTNVPVVALTATATVQTRREISQSLGLSNPTIISINPDRQNIYFASHPRQDKGDNKLDAILKPLAKELQEKRSEFPLTVIYGNLETISDCYVYFNTYLGGEQYEPVGSSPLAKNRLFCQFHAQYPEHERARIVKELTSGESKLRLLFVTVSFGIGVDINDIRRVIHIGVPYTMEEYFQEAGRCGRDGLPSTATIYYNSYDISEGRKDMSEIMRKFVRAKQSCKREMVLKYFGYATPKRSAPEHTCCDFHKQRCQCDSCLVSTVENLDLMEVQQAQGGNQSIHKERNIRHSETRKRLHKALVDYRLSLHGSGPSCVGSVCLATGFSLELIDMIVDQAEELTSVQDIKENYQFTVMHKQRKLWAFYVK